jgi:hypothetical protein
LFYFGATKIYPANLHLKAESVPLGECMYDYLQAGVTVKDKSGAKKIVTLITDGNVYWIYAGGNNRRHVMPYDRFIDTHFILARPTEQTPRAA